MNTTRLKQAFNWLSQRPVHNFTLVEAFQRHARKQPLELINANPLGFSRAGRALERVYTSLGVLGAATIILSAAPLLPAVGIAAAVLGLSKGLGVVLGKTADDMLRQNPVKESLSSVVKAGRSAALDYRQSKALLGIKRALANK